MCRVIRVIRVIRASEVVISGIWSNRLIRVSRVSRVSRVIVPRAVTSGICANTLAKFLGSTTTCMYTYIYIYMKQGYHGYHGYL